VGVEGASSLISLVISFGNCRRNPCSAMATIMDGGGDKGLVSQINVGVNPGPRMHFLWGGKGVKGKVCDKNRMDLVAWSDIYGGGVDLTGH